VIPARASHPQIARQKIQGPALVAAEQAGFNGWLAVVITRGVGSIPLTGEIHRATCTSPRGRSGPARRAPTRSNA
jgi:hypothetical protein